MQLGLRTTHHSALEIPPNSRKRIAATKALSRPVACFQKERRANRISRPKVNFPCARKIQQREECTRTKEKTALHACACPFKVQNQQEGWRRRNCSASELYRAHRWRANRAQDGRVAQRGKASLAHHIGQESCNCVEWLLLQNAFPRDGWLPRPERTKTLWLCSRTHG